jgi:hypothetical protein
MTKAEASKLLETAKHGPTREALAQAAGMPMLSPSVVAAAKSAPAIRMPKKRIPNQGEAEYGALLRKQFPYAHIEYEAVTLRLPSGTRYTGDWCVMPTTGRMLIVEVKGSYRLGSAAASARAFKEACAAFPNIEFWHVTKQEDGSWLATKVNS